MAKASTLQPAAATGIDAYCKDLAEWPSSWMGLTEDLVPGEKMVAYFRPFLEHLVELELSRKTIRKHVNNLWLLGGEIIRDLHETPALRKVPVETLVFNMIQDGGPILYHNDSERDFPHTWKAQTPRFPHSHRTATAAVPIRNNQSEQSSYTLHP